ncbi:MAG: glycine dehydrogenase, partial [Polyangiales bacterium]
EDLRSIAALAHAHDALLVTVTHEPYALALLESPGALGADICVGEGQPLAVPPQFGGPGVGLFACKQAYIRQMPGRLVGQTVDQNGHDGFVLTLSTREQHIRRERATSNICTNHGLIALAMTIRTAMLGRSGFVDAAKRCLNLSEHLKSELRRIEGVELPYSAPTFNEFVVRFSDPKAIQRVRGLQHAQLLAGLELRQFDASRQNELLIAVTEKHQPADLDRLVKALRLSALSV